MKSILRGLLTVSLLASFQSLAGTELHFRSGTVALSPNSLETLSRSSGEADYIIQFTSPIMTSDQALLKSNNIKVLRYVPDDAYIVRGRADTIKMSLEGRLTGMAAFEKSWKFSNEVAQAIAAIPFQGSEIQQAIRSFDIMAFSEADAKRLEKALRGKNHQRDGRMIRVQARLEDIGKIAEFSGIENIEATPQIESMHMNLQDEAGDLAGPGDYTDLTGYESGTKLINFETAWGQGFYGAGQIAAIADTGLDMGTVASVSADFQRAVKDGQAVGIGAKDWSDPMGHGTHVAGSILGRATLANGILKGGAYGAGAYPQGMWSPLIENLTVPPKLSQLFDPAYNYGARIHSNSWGSPRNLGSYDAMASQVDEFMYNHPDFLVVIAAGNSGTDKDKNGVIDFGSVSSPGTAKNSLTVGASENLVAKGGNQKHISDISIAKDNWPAEPIWSSKLSDNPDGIACFSSRGPTQDGRLKPEIVAPGTNILSARSHVNGANPMWGAYNDHYTYAGGTSMATPLTAGAATVTREILTKNYGVQNPSAALVKAMLINSAKDLFPGQYGSGTATQELKQRPDPNQGYGRVDMAAVLEQQSQRPLVIDERKGVQTSEAKEFVIEIKGGEGLLVNLVYTDAPGTPAAGKALVNDLDLEVQGPGGTLAPRDRINNHEVVEAPALTPGIYKIRVVGANVPMGKSQPFALIATIQ